MDSSLIPCSLFTLIARCTNWKPLLFAGVVGWYVKYGPAPNAENANTRIDKCQYNTLPVTVTLPIDEFMLIMLIGIKCNFIFIF